MSRYVFDQRVYSIVSSEVLSDGRMCHRLESISSPLSVIHRYDEELVSYEWSNGNGDSPTLNDGELVYYKNEWYTWKNTKDDCGILTDLDGHRCRDNDYGTVHYTEVYTEEELKEAYEEDYDEGRERALRYNDGKPRPSLIDPNFIMGLAEVLEMGAQKYGDYNWQKGMNQKDIMDSLMRHSLKYLSGNIEDEESGLHEMLHIAANAMFVYYFDTQED